MGPITQLLVAARAGDGSARDALFAEVYDELLRIARQRIALGPASTLLDAPSLVHEAYLRLSARDALAGADRQAFFAFASTVMRNLIFDLCRERQSLKRGGGALRVTLVTSVAADDADEMAGGDGVDVDALGEALAALARIDPRLHRVVELRYFGGLELEAVAEIEGRSLATIKRDWTKARAFLFDALRAS